MRFHTGEPPHNPEFDTGANGWSPIKEPSMGTVQLLGIPVAAVLLGLFGSWLYALGALDLDFDDSLLIQLVVALVLVLPMFFLHELAHALVHPGWGTSRQTVVGFWPQYLSFYAHYDAEMSRRRFMLCFLSPLVLLSVVPMLVMTVTGPSLLVGLLVLLNAMGAAGDVIGFILITSQVPAGSTIRNQGWRTFWRDPGIV